MNAPIEFLGGINKLFVLREVVEGNSVLRHPQHPRVNGDPIDHLPLNRDLQQLVDHSQDIVHRLWLSLNHRELDSLDVLLVNPVQGLCTDPRQDVESKEAIGMAGAFWMLRGNDYVGTLLGLAAALLGTRGKEKVETGAYSYLFQAGSRYY